MDGLQQEVEGERADAGDDLIPLDAPCPKCADGELVIDDGFVRCDTCAFRAA